MKSYHGYWPVLAIIKQYLGNVKKNLARDLEAPRRHLSQSEVECPTPSFGSNLNNENRPPAMTTEPLSVAKRSDENNVAVNDLPLLHLSTKY